MICHNAHTLGNAMSMGLLIGFFLGAFVAGWVKR
jgi:hypothetical protein